jgi:hypothetical protein
MTSASAALMPLREGRGVRPRPRYDAQLNGDELRLDDIGQVWTIIAAWTSLKKPSPTPSLLPPPLPRACPRP